MASEVEFKSEMTVDAFKQLFRDRFGVDVRVYYGVHIADGAATLAKVKVQGKGNGGTFTVHGNTKVGNVERECLETLGVKIQIEDERKQLADNEARIGELRASVAGGNAVTEVSASKAADVRPKSAHGGELVMSGQKHLGTLQKEFTAKFPFLGLAFFSAEEHGKIAKGERARSLANDLTLASVCTRQGGGEISLHGRTLTGNFEKKFSEIFGAHVQVVMHSAGGKHYTGADADALSLSELNDRAEKNGYLKYEY